MDLLHGRPGVYSARFAGAGASDKENIDKLLAELQGAPDYLKSARFWCVLVYMRHADDPTPIICQASWEGMIIDEPRGQHGFGYDPVFFVPDHDCTSAQMPAELKTSSVTVARPWPSSRLRWQRRTETRPGSGIRRHAFHLQWGPLAPVLLMASRLNERRPSLTMGSQPGPRFDF